MNKYQGTITIIGKPNVGKSSLLNTITGDKISIVNHKPQTTRNQIPHTFIDDMYHINFVDTPGFHEEKNKLDAFLNQEVKLALRNSNLIYFLCDGSRPFSDDDARLLQLIKHEQTPTFLVLSKNDIASSKQMEKLINQVSPEHNFAATLSISVQDPSTITKLLKESEKYLTFQEEPKITTHDTIQKDLFLVKEIIREQCLTSLRQEVPYGIAVLVDNFKYDKNRNELTVNASLNVEKESQKKILIGTNGSMIKEISTNARQELLKIYDAKIYLKLFVKVSKKWRDNLTKLKEFGYSH